MVLKLDHPPFSAGGNRACYLDPRQDDRCIKLMLPDRSPEKKHAAAPWWKRWRSVDSFNDNIEEAEELNHIAQSAPAIIGRHIPRCYGFVDTDLGKGLVTDLYRDYNGDISLNLRDYLQKNGKTPEITQAITTFQQAILQHQVLSRALLLHNIVAQELSPGEFCLYLIDGLGNPEFLPLADIIAFLRQRKIQRKLKKMDHHVEVIAGGGVL